MSNFFFVLDQDQPWVIVRAYSAILGPGSAPERARAYAPIAMTHLERHGRVHRGRIGVVLQSMTPEIAATAGISQANGAVVRSVEGNSAAERAGLKAGDAIVEIDGKAVQSASDVRNRIGLREAGSSVTITYLRQGKSQTVTLLIAELQ